MGLVIVNTRNGQGQAFGMSEDGKSVLVCHNWNNLPKEVRENRVKCSTVIIWYPIDQVEQINGKANNGLTDEK